MDNNQIIEGGSLLSSLSQLLFKGLGNILDSAAEYEEEMGVLKQVTRVKLVDANGDPTGYTLTIKLSPIRDKQGKYFVEAETDYPGLDVSSVNEKVIDLNNKNSNDFDKMIDDILKKNNIARSKADNNVDEDADEKESEDESSSDDESEEQDEFEDLDDEDRIKAMIERANEDPSITEIEVNYNGSDALLISQLNTIGDEVTKCQLVCGLTNAEGERISNVPQLNETVHIVDVQKNFLSYSRFVEIVKDKIATYARKNKIDADISGSTNTVSATFVKSSETDDISLVAIKASCNIKAAMNMIEDVVSYDEFVSGLNPEEEKSFAIVDNGSDYDITEVAEIDTSETYDVLFNAICNICNKIQMYKWVLGKANWYCDTRVEPLEACCTDLLDTCAEWVIKHTAHYPCIPETSDGLYELCSVDAVVNSLISELNDLILLFDTYCVNLEPDEQVMLDKQLFELKRITNYT